jgi:hypothetical protein
MRILISQNPGKKRWDPQTVIEWLLDTWRERSWKRSRETDTDRQIEKWMDPVALHPFINTRPYPVVSFWNVICCYIAMIAIMAPTENPQISVAPNYQYLLCSLLCWLVWFCFRLCVGFISASRASLFVTSGLEVELASPVQAPAHVKSTNIPLVQAYHMTEPEINK